MSPGEQFKGMKPILQGHGLMEETEPCAECPNLNCPDKSITANPYCCQRALYNQPDFLGQKPAVVEYIESRGCIAF